MFVREFARVLEEAFRGRTLFVDLFGGSGLLSRTIKDTLPDARDFYLRECNSGIRSMGINDRPFAISDKQDQEDDVDVKAVLADIAERMGYC